MASAAPEPIAELEWNFSQVFGERTPGEEVQDGARERLVPARPRRSIARGDVAPSASANPERTNEPSRSTVRPTRRSVRPHRSPSLRPPIEPFRPPDVFTTPRGASFLFITILTQRT